MHLPAPRGPMSSAVASALQGNRPADAELLLKEVEQLADTGDVVTDEDLHAMLWTLYELHYRGFDEVEAGREWDPDLLRVRLGAEAVFEAELRRRAAPYVEQALATDGDVADQIADVVEAVPGPSIAHFVQREATREQVAELMTARSIYHLKESDPSALVLARVDGATKAALAELLYDEYGGGRPDRLHATMFARALEGCGLDPSYGAYVDVAPGHTLALNNAMSLFGLNRRLRAASLGHLAAFETTSSLPCRRFVSGMQRLGFPDVVWEYFDEHIEADAVHEQVALHDICGTLVAAEPQLREDVLFGAATCLLLDAVVAEPTLDAWRSGRSSLRTTPQAVGA